MDISRWSSQSKSDLWRYETTRHVWVIQYCQLAIMLLPCEIHINLSNDIRLTCNKWCVVELVIKICEQAKFINFHSGKSISKCRLENGGHPVSASMYQLNIRTYAAFPALPPFRNFKKNPLIFIWLKTAPSVPIESYDLLVSTYFVSLYANTYCFGRINLTNANYFTNV